MSTIMITGGAGFIGSALVRFLIETTTDTVVNVDKLTYAGNLESLASVEQNERYHFEQVDICDGTALKNVFDKYQPDKVMHLAAESHVDRSIDDPSIFVQTNIVGTYMLLECIRTYWSALDEGRRSEFRLLLVSTNEVFGDLGTSHGSFTEETPYAPSSPYSASKASADHLARAWHRTYGLPIIVTNCSNNYGPFQFPEKLIPLAILYALEGKPIPVYGGGRQIRDWLYVEDHVRALCLVLTRGNVGETYNIGGHNEQCNIDVVNQICHVLDELRPIETGGSYHDLITHVADRPGHDLHYAVDASRIGKTLGWKPVESFSSGLTKTVKWYVANRDWCCRVQQGRYCRQRLGLGI